MVRPKIVAVRLDPVTGGTEVSLMAQSPGGVRYRYSSLVVMSQDKRSPEARATRKQAIQRLLADLA
jgi:hypothetical protein